MARWPGERCDGVPEAFEEPDMALLLEERGVLLEPADADVDTDANGVGVRATAESAAPRQPRSHTARCRAKVNAKFDDLLRVLPPPPPHVSVRHKAQVLAYACSVFEAIAARQAALEAELVLAHPSRMQAWLRANVAGRHSLQEALEPVVRLLMERTAWKCADCWIPCDDSPHSALRFSLSAIQPGKPHSDPLYTFLRASAALKFLPAVGVPGRVYASRRPEWLTRIAPPPTFLRASSAQQTGIVTCFALPIVANGRIVAVVALYDTCQRDYDGDVYNISQNIVGAVNEIISSSLLPAPATHTAFSARGPECTPPDL